MFFTVYSKGFMFEAIVLPDKNASTEHGISLGSFKTTTEAEAELERWSEGVPFLTLRKRFAAMGV